MGEDPFGHFAQLVGLGVGSGLNRETHLGILGLLKKRFLVFFLFQILRWVGEEMNGQGEERTAFEIGVVVPKRGVKEKNEEFDCVEVLVEQFKDAGLIVERVIGVADEFIKV